MFMNYSINQWVGLGQYFIIVLVLSIGVYFASVKLTYKRFRGDKGYKRSRVKQNRKDCKKQVFFDVA